jgi:hypothetical protein
MILQAAMLSFVLLVGCCLSARVSGSWHDLRLGSWCVPTGCWSLDGASAVRGQQLGVASRCVSRVLIEDRFFEGSYLAQELDCWRHWFKRRRETQGAGVSPFW